MGSGSSAVGKYVMGHNDRERRRLSLQASVINPLTEDFLRRAGIAAGMRVLDIGCGVGEVTMIAARLVGVRGHITAIDIDPAALELVNARAKREGFAHVSTEQRECDAEGAGEFDAVVGRHILVHVPDALHVIKRASEMVHQGGIVAFQEFDFRGYPIPCSPRLPLYESTMKVICDLFLKLGRGSVAADLFRLFRQAGLSHPQVRVDATVEGGADCVFYEWIAESLRSILPRVEELGLANASDFDIETLADRLREETVAANAAIVAPAMFGAFGRRT